MRHILLAVLAALACASASAKKDAGSPAPPGSAPAQGRRLMVVGINDTHGALLSIPPPNWLSPSGKPASTPHSVIACAT